MAQQRYGRCLGGSYSPAFFLRRRCYQRTARSVESQRVWPNSGRPWPGRCGRSRHSRGASSEHDGLAIHSPSRSPALWAGRTNPQRVHARIHAHSVRKDSYEHMFHALWRVRLDCTAKSSHGPPTANRGALGRAPTTRPPGT
jgi:hypothetical protein